MGSHALAIRAITAVFVRRILKWVFIAGAGIVIISFVITAYLASAFSVWWWLLLVIIWPPTIIAIIIAGLLWLITSRLLPRNLDRQERRQIGNFTDKLFGVAETARTPYPLLLLLVGKDLIRGRQSRFITNAIDDSKSLQGDYENIRTKFN